MADCHLGAWRDPRMSELVLNAFESAVSTCLDNNVDFVIIAGDFLNTSLPGIDVVRFAVRQLMRLQDAEIPVYLIPGSHDYSTSGKTMLNVIEEAGVITNVAKGDVVDDQLQLRFTEDEQTGAKLTGILGRRGALERNYYKDLNRDHLEDADGPKIFVFHSAIEELKPKRFEQVQGAPLSYLPKDFDYYAGGHVHMVKATSVDGYDNIVYPGPLFPASFSELEELTHGGFYIYDDGDITRKSIQLKPVLPLHINAEGKSAEEVKLAINEEINDNDFVDTIVLLRIEGQLQTGKATDIELKSLIETMYDNGAYFVMKNTNKLTTEEFNEVTVEQGTPEEIEERVLDEHLTDETTFDQHQTARDLMDALGQEQDEAEKKYEYEERMKSDGMHALGLAENTDE
jgi:hypothetical protein